MMTLSQKRADDAESLFIWLLLRFVPRNLKGAVRGAFLSFLPKNELLCGLFENNCLIH
jgi:hypothetical protein